MLGSGRSPGFPTFSAAFPSRISETVARDGRKVFLSCDSKGWVHSGGPAPDSHGVPHLSSSRHLNAANKLGETARDVKFDGVALVAHEIEPPWVLRQGRRQFTSLSVGCCQPTVDVLLTRSRVIVGNRIRATRPLANGAIVDQEIPIRHRRTCARPPACGPLRIA